MRAGQSSLTSSIVALMRSLAHEGLTGVQDFSDPVAGLLLPFPFSLLNRAVTGMVRDRPLVARLMWEAGAGMMDILPLRSRAIDDACLEALDRGIRQLVILGAGLDGRAWRLELDDVTVFEVDHPSTQRHKRARTATMPHKAAALHFVEIDFTTDQLEVALEAAGHRADRPTFWIWEGVTMYLEPAAVAATLASMASRSAPGSGMAVTYLPRNFEETGMMTLVKTLVAGLGEPFKVLLDPELLAGMLGDCGFSVVSDTGMREWARAYSLRAPRMMDHFQERLVVAERVKPA